MHSIKSNAAEHFFFLKHKFLQSFELGMHFTERVLDFLYIVFHSTLLSSLKIILPDLFQIQIILNTETIL